MIRMTDKEGSLKEISDKLEAINETLKKAFVESKEPKKNDNELEILKIQIYTDRCHALFTSALSFGIAFFTLVACSMQFTIRELLL